MKGLYYLRRGFNILGSQGIGEVCRQIIKLLKFWVYRWSNGRMKLKSMQNELRGLPERMTIEEVFSTACSLGGGAIAPMQDRREFIGLLSRVFEGAPIRNLLEIGTCGGGSFFCFCRLAEPDGIVISVDLPGGFFGGGAAKWRIRLFECFARNKQKLHLLRLNSHDNGTLKRTTSLLSGQQLDLLFIDGDHTFEGVKQDFEMYSPLVKPGGYVGFHDTLNDSPEGTNVFGVKIGVGRYWRGIRDQYRHWDFEQSERIGIGVIQMPLRD